MTTPGDPMIAQPILLRLVWTLMPSQTEASQDLILRAGIDSTRSHSRILSGPHQEKFLGCALPQAGAIPSGVISEGIDFEFAERSISDAVIQRLMSPQEKERFLPHPWLWCAREAVFKAARGSLELLSQVEIVDCSQVEDQFWRGRALGAGASELDFFVTRLHAPDLLKNQEIWFAYACKKI